MKISYNWLKTLINIDLPAEKVAELLTASGLEVEGIETFESMKGGLKGIVVGEVVEKEKHPDADRLSVTKVNIGQTDLLNIVCGAPNVAAGQKVLVATIGAKLYPTSGEPFEIKKSKIRGALSEGMICAEDEIGMGKSHEGILVLPPNTAIGTLAADYFKLEEDTILEIGLTPNRSDAASHYGVARDLVAILNSENQENVYTTTIHGLNELPKGSNLNKVTVNIENAEACPRYSGVVISGVTVEDSPSWLKSRLASIGLKPINNIVDITNYVLHELGQPLHAFDLNKIADNTITVKTFPENTLFKTLDGVERKLSPTDLMIGDSQKPLCIAGVFGGSESGVTKDTKAIFLESAFFNANEVRKTAKRHGLKTDASFRFERGTDPEMTIPALIRAANLILEIAGGVISMDIIDVYPQPLEPYKVAFSYGNCQRLIGKEIEKSIIKRIIQNLCINIVKEGSDGLLLNVPRFKSDVTREADVIEEVMRIYGFNNVETSTHIKFSVSDQEKNTAIKIENTIADFLVSNGFNEAMSLSLTKEAYYTDNSRTVKVLNPLSSDLNILRESMLFSGLENIAYNINRRTYDLKLFEFGKTYRTVDSPDNKYNETKHLTIFACGRKNEENPYGENAKITFSYIKSLVEAILKRVGITNCINDDITNESTTYGLSYTLKKKTIATIGLVSKSICKQFDINTEVYYADINWDNLLNSSITKKDIEFKELTKFPEVRRDLALLLDKSIKYEQVKQLAFDTERKLLKGVNLFDIYEGDKLEQGKKSYAVSYTLQDADATLTDKQIEAVMQKLVKMYSEKLGATLR